MFRQERDTSGTFPQEGVMSSAAAQPEIEVVIEEIPQEESFEVRQLDDGSIVLESIDPSAQEMDVPVSHSDNLANILPDERLSKIGGQVFQWKTTDQIAREKWQNAYAKQLDLLGLQLPEERTTPFQGACGYIVPVATEALVRFQSQTIQEIFSPDGPVKTKILGKSTKEKEEQGERVKNFMNREFTKTNQYRNDTERLLWSIGKAGSAFRKIWPEKNIDGTRTIRSAFVAAEDVYLPYGTQSLDRAERIIQSVRIAPHELERMQRSGIYRDVPVSETPDYINPVKEKQDEINNEVDPAIGSNPVIYECSCYIDAEDEGFRSPYLVTIDSAGKILSLYRNWREDDPNRTRLNWLVQYNFIPPDDTPYAYGVIHLTAHSAKTATGALRALMDAATLANLSGGFKQSEARIKGGTVTVQPGTFKDIDYSGKLADAFFPLPFQQPSPVIAGLIEKVVEDGRRIGSIPTAKISDIGSQAPVGTTLALMEDANMVVSAVQARIYASLREEFQIYARLYAEILPESHTYEAEEREGLIMSDDFDERIDIIPVADPRSSSRSQQITAYSVATQLSAQAPQVYDLPQLHRAILKAAGINDIDRIVPDKTETAALGPEAELMAIMTGKPVKAHKWQNHQAHITVLMAFKQDPETAKYVGQSVNASVIAAAIDALIQEHYAYLFTEKMEEKLGVVLPPVTEPLPPEVERHLAESKAAAAQKVLESDKAAAARQEAEAKAQDPVIQMQQRDLELRAAEIARKGQESAAKIDAANENARLRAQIEKMRIESQERIEKERSIDSMEKYLAELKVETQRMRDQREKLKAETKLTQARTLEIVSNMSEEENGKPEEGIPQSGE